MKHQDGSMISTQSQARRSGLLYALASSLAPFAYLYVPGVLLVEGSALATVDRVRASENLLRAAIVAELYGVTVLLFASLALYHLFKNVDQKSSFLMAAMMLVSVPISYVNTLFNIAPLVLLKSPAIGAVLGPGETAAQVVLFLRLHNYGLVVNQIFWGLWLFPMGALVIRSGFIPRWLAYPLFFAGAGYVINSFGAFLPPWMRAVTQYGQILGVGEMPFTFYLLIWGARGCPLDRLATFLVVLSFVIGTGALVLLNIGRIDPTRYAILVLASLAVIFGLVIRWRWLESSTATAAART
ncbi:MAG TPA: DUF4386 domain-containing protein [Candidatus Polarisedimenticolia bacterium]|nr:DUF4386 domain-containing protein [Candidatus Polarisedimenticolia bacterium]